MFTNLEGCTVYEKTVQNRTPAYTRHEFGAVCWQPDMSMESGNDRTPHNDDFISVPEDSADYLPKRGDLIVNTVVPDVQPPVNALTITEVKDLRYGSKRVRHIEMKAR